jgi:predicted nucleic acid-binding protein
MLISRICELPAVPLSDLPLGSDVFVDANVFVYGLLELSPECQTLLRRCAQEEVFGFTTLHVLNEMTHRLMLEEARQVGLISGGGASQLKKQAREIVGLRRYWEQTLNVLEMPSMMVLHMQESWLHRAHSERAQCGLLTNDSLIVAAMREYGLALLASNDGDFDRVLGVTRYFPSDLSLPAQ